MQTPLENLEEAEAAPAQFNPVQIDTEPPVGVLLGVDAGVHDCVDNPLQGTPPLEGVGFVHDRVCVESEAHVLHAVQPPFTAAPPDATGNDDAGRISQYAPVNPDPHVQLPSV